MIKIYSDREEITLLVAQLKALNISYTFLGSKFNPKDDLKENEFYLFHLSNLNSLLFHSILSIPSTYSYNCFFVLLENKKLLNEIITKIGFQNIFSYPEYKAKLDIALIDSGLQDSKKNIAKKEKISKSFKNIVGNSTGLKKAKMLAETAALNPSLNILIVGEAGTGKRLFAQSIHKSTYGVNRPFVDVICNSFSETLLETELFGYEKNAFEGANVKKNGLFELADTGTIYFDGIDDISLNIQAKLLSILEKKSVRRIGSLKEIPLHVRVIASSIKDLKSQVTSMQFRQDLLYCLNAVIIELTPLRERKEDIILIAQSFVDEFCERYGKKEIILDEKLKEALINYHWPGNIRELRNTIERAIVLSHSTLLTEEHLEFTAQEYIPVNKKFETVSSHIISLNINYKLTDLETLTESYAKEVLSRMNGSKIKTAKLLNISRPKLDKLLRSNSKKKN